MARYQRADLHSAINAAQKTSQDRPQFVCATSKGYAVVSAPPPCQSYYQVQGATVEFVEFDTGCPKTDIDWMPLPIREDTIMRAVGYIRVSTDRQAEQGISLDLQRAKVDAYCQLHDWTLLEVLSDDGYSAKTLTRPAMQRLLAMVDARAIDAIIVYKLDRLSRKTRDVLQLVERFEVHDVGLHSIQESLDTKSAIGRFVLRTLASLAEMERDMISERTTEALRHLKAEGKAYCRPRFVDADVLAWLQAEHAAGKSYRELVAMLQARGIPTARGGQWQASTVRLMLLDAPTQPSAEEVA